MGTVHYLPNAKAAKLEDVKPGAVLYSVHAVPSRDSSIETWIDTLEITSEPYPVNAFGSTLGLFASYQRDSAVRPGEKYKDTFSLLDSNIVKNSYNCHRTFKTLEDAEEYSARIKNKESWTEEERAIFEHWNKIEDYDDYDDYGY